MKMELAYEYWTHLVVESAEEDAEELTQIHVVGRFVKAQPATIVQVHGKLGGKTLAQHFHRSRHFLKEFGFLLFN